MALFYLNLCNGGGFVSDDEGQDLSTLGAARQIAVQSLRDVLAGEVQDGRFNVASFIEIEDQDRRHVATVCVDDAVAMSDTVARPPRLLG